MRHSAKPFVESLEPRLALSGTPTPLQFNLTSMVAPSAWAAPSASAHASKTTPESTLQAPTTFAGDFNGDAASDIAIFTADARWQVFLSQRDQFAAPFSSDWQGSNWQKLAVGDLNADGKDDVVGLDTSGRWSWALSTGSSLGPRVTHVPMKNVYREFFVGNFIGDAREEILAWDVSARWWLLRVSANRLESMPVTYEETRPHGWSNFVQGDFNGDHYADVAVLRSSSQWWVWFGGSKGITEQQWTTSWFMPGGWKKTLAADVNGDRKTDLLALGSNGVWYVAKASVGKFLPALWSTQWAKGDVWHDIVATDVDDDGKDDLIGRHVSGTLWTLRSTAKTPTVRKQASPGAMGVGRMLAGDFNGDGRGDLAVPAENGRIFVGLSDGAKLYFGVRSPKPFFYVAPWDMNTIRKNPSQTRAVFLRYLPTLKATLRDRLPPLSEHLYAMIFANIVAFEHASYFGVGDSGKLPNYLSLTSQLAAPRLECNNYDFLTVHLYRRIFPALKSDPTVIRMVGWDKGTFGNHSQLLVTDKGITLLVDPNLGLVARTDLASLRKGKKIRASEVIEFSFRKERTFLLERSLNSFRTRVRDALVNGRFNKATLLYNRNAEQILGYRK